MRVKKTVIMLLFLSFIFSIPAYADGISEETQTLPYYVSDVAGILSSEQQTELNETAERISEQYNCGVYIVTLEDYTEYSGTDIFTFTQNFYKAYHLGMGDSRSGILLLLSMSGRDYSLVSYGSNAHYAFTDYGQQVLSSRFLDNFRTNDWYGGFSDYLECCDDFLARAGAGNPFDISYESGRNSSNVFSFALIAGVPSLVAIVVCETMKRKMKPVIRESRADEYIVPGGINLSVKRDVFINRTITRTVIRTENRTPSCGGTGGTTVNAGGFSGHSGKF